MSGDYTPTTYQIRLGYRAAWGPTNVATRPEVDGIADEAFDRGMAAHDAEVRKHAGENALWNQANNVGTAIAHGQLDGTDPVAVAKAIRATTPAEFAAACSTLDELLGGVDS